MSQVPMQRTEALQSGDKIFDGNSNPHRVWKLVHLPDGRIDVVLFGGTVINSHPLTLWRIP